VVDTWRRQRGHSETWAGWCVVLPVVCVFALGGGAFIHTLCACAYCVFAPCAVNCCAVAFMLRILKITHVHAHIHQSMHIMAYAYTCVRTYVRHARVHVI